MWASAVAVNSDSSVGARIWKTGVLGDWGVSQMLHGYNADKDKNKNLAWNVS